MEKQALIKMDNSLPGLGSVIKPRYDSPSQRFSTASDSVTLDNHGGRKDIFDL